MMHVLDELAFQAGGRDISLKKVMVHTQVIHYRTDIFDETTGLDALWQCSRMTLNFESTSFILK